MKISILNANVCQENANKSFLNTTNCGNLYIQIYNFRIILSSSFLWERRKKNVTSYVSHIHTQIVSTRMPMQFLLLRVIRQRRFKLITGFSFWPDLSFLKSGYLELLRGTHVDSQLNVDVYT